MNIRIINFISTSHLTSKFVYLTFLLLILAPSIVKTQINTFEKIIGTENDEYARSVAQISDDMYFILGSTNNTDNNDYNILLLKIDKAGNVIQENFYGELLNDYGIYISQTSDSCFVLSCNSNQESNISTENLIMKINSDGDTLWTYKFIDENDGGKIGEKNN